MSQSETDVLETSARPAMPGRRRVLGALALGAVATACNVGDESLSLQTPGSEGGPSSTATGPELVKVEFPAKETGGAVDAGGAATPSSSTTASTSTSQPVTGGNAATPGPPTTAAATPSTAAPTTAAPTAAPPTVAPTTAAVTPTTAAVTPTTAAVTPTTAAATSTTAAAVTTAAPTTAAPTTAAPTTAAPTTAAPTTAAPTTSAFAPPPPVAADAVHVANRITFGITPAVQTQLNALGTLGYIDDQLSKTGPDPAVEAQLGGFDLPGLTRRQVYNYLRNDNNSSADLMKELTHLAVIRGVYSEHQLFEMMCQLWMDHFNINMHGDNVLRHLHIDFQENVIRPNAMGTFRDLLVATANSTAMLAYLDNTSSDATAEQGFNENYGRELLELHTLGIHADDSQVYNEADVRAASAAMTGWSMVTNRNADNHTDFLFRADYQFTGEISLLNGAWTKGATTGKATGDSLLQFLATHESTARYIALKICRRFVSDNPPASLVASTAQAYLANDTSITATLRHVLTSAEFAASTNQKMRRPIEGLIAALRALNATVSTNPDSEAATNLRNQLAALDHLPWNWEQPDGYPDYAGYWLSTAGLLSRWNFGARMARGQVDGIAVNYGALKPPSDTGDALIMALGAQFGIGDLPAAARTAIATAAGAAANDGAGNVSDRELGDIAALILAHPLSQTR